MHLQIIDISWTPVRNNTHRDYLFLTYGPSSRMEYPSSWSERMELWENTIPNILGSNEEEWKSDKSIDIENESKPLDETPDLSIV